MVRGSASNLFDIYLAKTNGGPKTTLTSASSGLKIALKRELSAAPTVYSGSNIESITTVGAFVAPTSGKVRFKEISASDLPGWYQIQIANALVDTADTSRFITGMIQCTGVTEQPFTIPLTSADQQAAPAVCDSSGRVTVIPADGIAQAELMRRLLALMGGTTEQDEEDENVYSFKDISGDVVAVMTIDPATKERTVVWS